MIPIGSFVLVVFATYVSALYETDSDVINLTPTTFPSRVIDSEDIWIVEFFAPWCGHCQTLAPEYAKAAKALKGVVKIAAVDADEHKSLAGQFGVKGFPTIKIFSGNKQKPQNYQGARTAKGLVDAAFKELRNSVNEKLGGQRSSRSDGGDGGSQKESDGKDVIELNDGNFKSLVLDSNDMWLVEFYAPWCGHCQRLQPEWARAATELKGKVKLGVLDATAETITNQKYNIKGFPTIKFFPAGPKDGSAEDYDGDRSSEGIVTWALNKVSENAPPPEVHQITKSDILKDTCENHPLCVISILPHILDCQSTCRNNYLNILREVGNKYRKNSWGWAWAEAMAQPELEAALEIGGFGYPAMAIVNIRKMKYSILRGSFSFDGIAEFVRTVSAGRSPSAPVKGAKLPDITILDPWDGKDGELPVEEEIDLSDVSLDDDDTNKQHTEL